jgi:lipopolysaccharide transport system permease protein
VLIRRLLRFRGLLATLTRRELTARYRGSMLGFFWSLAHPLLLLGVYSVVFSLVFQPRMGGAEPYAVFLVAGLFPWIWFSTSLLDGAGALSASAGLIRKAVFPAEVLPLVSVLANLVHLLLALPILAGALLLARLAGYPVGGWSALLLPALVAVQLPFIAGLALGLSALTAHFKDVRDLLQNVLTLLFFLTPILYPLEAVRQVPGLIAVILANPLTPFLRAYQQLLFEGTVPALGSWLQMAGLALLSWAVGAWLFERLSETLVEAV